MLTSCANLSTRVKNELTRGASYRRRFLAIERRITSRLLKKEQRIPSVQKSTFPIAFRGFLWASEFFFITLISTNIDFKEPETILLEEPQPFFKLLSVRCYMYSPQDEEFKTEPIERLKNAPPDEAMIGKPLPRFSIPKSLLSLSTFILQGMVWWVWIRIQNRLIHKICTKSFPVCIRKNNFRYKQRKRL